MVLLVVCEMITYVTTTPHPREQYFNLYVLGANRMASNYYPNNNPNIKLGEPVTWYLAVTDNMGIVQLVSIRVKVSNRTIGSPDDKQTSGSPAPVVIDLARFLLDNQTWEVPFVWSIQNATKNGGSMRILALQINNETYQISDWSASEGYNFRLIFELWTWQTDSNRFEFGWNTDGQHRIAWLQLWFNMTTLGPHP